MERDKSRREQVRKLRMKFIKRIKLEADVCDCIDDTSTIGRAFRDALVIKA